MEDLERQEAIDKLQKQKDLASAMGRLLENPDYQMVIEEYFIKDYTLTAMANLAVFSDMQRMNAFEQMTARSIFKDKTDDIIQIGMAAADGLNQIALMEQEEAKAEAEE